MRMVRKQVYIEERQERALKELAKKTGRAEAELIRDAIDRILAVTPQPTRDLSAWEEEKRFMRERMKRLKVPPQKRTWTREDAYDRKVFRRR